MTAVHKVPAGYPSGKAGDVITVEFTVLGIACLGLNGGAAFKHSEAFSFQIATDDQAEADRYSNVIVRQWWPGKRLRLLQGPLGPVLADHPTRADRCPRGRWPEAKRAFEAMMSMKNDVAAVEAARRG